MDYRTDHNLETNRFLPTARGSQPQLVSEVLLAVRLDNGGRAEHLKTLRPATTTPPTPSKIIEAFTSLLHIKEEAYSVFTCHRPKDGAIGHYWRKSSDDLGDLPQTLLKMNLAGYDIYLGMGQRSTYQTSGRGKKSDVQHLTALWVDLDDCDDPSRLYAFSPRPSLITRTGGGFHAYWLLDDPIPADSQAESLLRRLALLLDGDVKVADTARVMRVPGTVNCKPGRDNALCSVIHTEDIRYTLEDFAHLPSETEIISQKTWDKVWYYPQMARRAVALKLLKCYRLWLLLENQTRQDRGDGRYTLKELTALSGRHRKNVKETLEAGDGLFWRLERSKQDGKIVAVRHTKPEKLDADLSLMAAEAGVLDAWLSDSGRLWLERSVLIGGDATLAPELFAGWLSTYTGNRKRSSQNIFGKLWGRDAITIRRWIKSNPDLYQQSNMNSIRIPGQDEAGFENVWRAGKQGLLPDPQSKDWKVPVWEMTKKQGDNHLDYLCWKRPDTVIYRSKVKGAGRGRVSRITRAIHATHADYIIGEHPSSVRVLTNARDVYDMVSEVGPCVAVMLNGDDGEQTLVISPELTPDLKGYPIRQNHKSVNGKAKTRTAESALSALPLYTHIETIQKPGWSKSMGIYEVTLPTFKEIS